MCEAPLPLKPLDDYMIFHNLNYSILDCYKYITYPHTRHLTMYYQTDRLLQTFFTKSDGRSDGCSSILLQHENLEI